VKSAEWKIGIGDEAAESGRVDVWDDVEVQESCPYLLLAFFSWRRVVIIGMRWNSSLPGQAFLGVWACRKFDFGPGESGRVRGTPGGSGF
jgi:hypothetical protein